MSLTLKFRINVYVRLFFWAKFSTLYWLIRACTIIFLGALPLCTNLIRACTIIDLRNVHRKHQFFAFQTPFFALKSWHPPYWTCTQNRKLEQINASCSLAPCCFPFNMTPNLTWFCEKNLSFFDIFILKRI